MITAFSHNPFKLSHMEEVVDRIFMAVSEEEKVMVFGDRDVDGITSTVIMVQTLRALGLDVQWRFLLVKIIMASQLRP